MSTRREFMRNAGVVALASATSIEGAQAAEEKKNSRPPNIPGADAPLAVGGIRSATCRDETLRRIGGTGAFPCLSWGANDEQLLTVIEGAGWPGLPQDLYVESALVAVSGPPESAQFQALAGYPYYPIRQCYRPDGAPIYANTTALSVEGQIYVLYAAFGDAFKIVGDYFVLHENRGAKLTYSPDQGRSWRNQDGSSPVVYEPAQQQSRHTMALWKEPQDAFAMPSFLQMGRDYQANRDGYVYVYGSMGAASGVGFTPLNALAMFRVPKAHVLDRGFYEYFAGWQRDGTPEWTKEINARAAVHTFPAGTCTYGSWNFGGAVYNEALGVYMMAGWIGGLVPADFLSLNEPELAKNVLGLWTAAHPWGPWTQVVNIDPWFPGGDYTAKVISLTMAPKWISDDGRSFWIVWQDIQHSSDYRPELYKEWYYAKTDEEATQATIRYRRAHPRLCFNTQRIDLKLA